MRKKFLGILLILTLSVSSLSSCLLFERDGISNINGGTSGGKDTIINVEGGPNYGDITINSSSQGALLAASKAVLSSVSVKCVFEEYEYSWTGSASGTQKTSSAGSGVIYKLDKESGDAYVITNYHVVFNENSTAQNHISNEIYLFLYGMEMMAEGNVSYAIPATYVGGSINYDIAVLKVEDSTVLMQSNARAVDIADSDKVTILDTAIAIGNPGTGCLSATVGYINVDSERIYVQIDNTQEAVELRVMRTDAAVNSGNSGGGLFNDKGELIGIVNAKDANTSVENVGYAIPSNVAKAIADSAIHYSDGTVKRCLLGITVGVKKYSTEYDVESGKIYKLEEVVITEISAGSAVNGLLKKGDVINSITVDGVKHEVTRIHHVVDSMLYARVGSTVVINMTRGGVQKDVTVPITESMLKNS